MAEPFNKYADYFDIRAVIARFEELESMKEDGDIDDDDSEEYLILLSFLEEVKGRGEDEQWRGDWYPVTFLHEDHFVEAMEERDRISATCRRKSPLISSSIGEPRRKIFALIIRRLISTAKNSGIVNHSNQTLLTSSQNTIW